MFCWAWRKYSKIVTVLKKKSQKSSSSEFVEPGDDYILTGDDCSVVKEVSLLTPFYSVKWKKGFRFHSEWMLETISKPLKTRNYYYKTF